MTVTALISECWMRRENTGRRSPVVAGDDRVVVAGDDRVGIAGMIYEVNQQGHT